MKFLSITTRLLLLFAFLAPPLALMAQDNVTIPKSRLQELERKEKELERLKTQVPDTNAPVGQTQRVTPAPARASAATPVVTRQSPPLATLPPIQQGEAVEAIDLANYYREDKAAADQRFKNRKLVVRGEIAAFEKPMLRRDYRLLLQTGDRDTKVVCDLFPPEKFNSVFTVSHGSQLVGLQGETQVPIAKIGETVLVKGSCKGFKDGVVAISGLEFSRPK